MRYLIASLLVIAIAAPAPAAAQCASCGNPAFASGDNDVSRTMDTKGAVDEWRVRAALVYGTMVSDEYFEGSESWGNPDNFKMTMHLLTLSTTVASPWGTSLSALVPWGSLQLEKNFLDDQEADVGLGDVELRLRHDVSRFWGSKGPRVVLSLGAALPTGIYVAPVSSSGEGGGFNTGGGFGGGGFGDIGGGGGGGGADDSDGSSRYLSLGRDVLWLLADLEVFGTVNNRLGYYVSVASRFAAGEASDGFAWGPEVRYIAGVNAVLLPKWINASFLTEYQWRAKSTSLVQGERQTFANGGGSFVTLMPTIQGNINSNLSVSVSGRLPVYRDAVGIQVVEGSSVWLTLSGRFSVSVRKSAPSMFVKNKPTNESLTAARQTTKVGERTQIPEIAALLVSGKTTIVDYWATWCKPCKKLDKVVKTYVAEGHPEVIFKKFDASDWGKPEWLKYLPDAPTLPVLDIYGPDGALQARLSGDAAFRFREHLEQK